MMNAFELKLFAALHDNSDNGKITINHFLAVASVICAYDYQEAKEIDYLKPLRKEIGNIVLRNPHLFSDTSVPASDSFFNDSFWQKIAFDKRKAIIESMTCVAINQFAGGV